MNLLLRPPLVHVGQPGSLIQTSLPLCHISPTRDSYNQLEKCADLQTEVGALISRIAGKGPAEDVPECPARERARRHLGCIHRKLDLPTRGPYVTPSLALPLLLWLGLRVRQTGAEREDNSAFREQQRGALQPDHRADRVETVMPHHARLG